MQTQNVYPNEKCTYKCKMYTKMKMYSKMYTQMKMYIQM